MSPLTIFKVILSAGFDAGVEGAGGDFSCTLNRVNVTLTTGTVTGN